MGHPRLLCASRRSGPPAGGRDLQEVVTHCVLKGEDLAKGTLYGLHLNDMTERASAALGYLLTKKLQSARKALG